MESLDIIMSVGEETEAGDDPLPPRLLLERLRRGSQTPEAYETHSYGSDKEVHGSERINMVGLVPAYLDR